jgi:ubiquinone/menaquinone biosynthesis C-methylase UbiE
MVIIERKFDNSVDKIVACHLIEHFSFIKSGEALREWHRALKPGGQIILETPDFLNCCRMFVDADETTRLVLYNNFFAWPDAPGQSHYFLFTEYQLASHLIGAGFDNIGCHQIRSTPKHPIHRGWIPF